MSPFTCTWLFYSFELVRFRSVVDIVHRSPGYEHMVSAMTIECGGDETSGRITVYGQSKIYETTQATGRFELARYPVEDYDERVRLEHFEFSALPEELDRPPISVLRADVTGDVAGELILLGSIAASHPFRDAWIEQEDKGHLFHTPQSGWLEDSHPATRPTIDELGFRA